MLLLLWVAGIFALLCIMMAACRDIHVLFFAAFWAFPVFSLLNGGKRLELLALLGVAFIYCRNGVLCVVSARRCLTPCGSNMPIRT
jgi:hypothetical protein